MGGSGRFLVLLLGLFILLTGCGGPKGLPRLYKCPVKIVQEGTPLVEATVQFHSEDPELSKFTIIGLTDESGIINPMTRTYPGVPKGKYKITVTKDEMEDLPEEQLETEVVDTFVADNGKTVEIVRPSRLTPIAQREAYSLVDEEYLDVETTPLELEVTKSVKEPVVFDVGPAP